MITGKSGSKINDNVDVLIFVPGVQDPASRRQARKLKRKDAERDYGDNLVNLVYPLDDDDDEREEEEAEEEEEEDSDDDLDVAPSSKRQRV